MSSVGRLERSKVMEDLDPLSLLLMRPPTPASPPLSPEEVVALPTDLEAPPQCGDDDDGAELPVTLPTLPTSSSTSTSPVPSKFYLV